MEERQKALEKAGKLKSALVGMVFGVDGAGHCIALATICCAGAMSAGLGIATAVFLLGSAVATLALFWHSGFRLAVGVAQDTSIAILAPAVVLATAAATGPAGVEVSTGLAVIGCSALLSGLAFWLVGRFGLGQLVRMFPYPVAAGFLASSGYLLVFAAVQMVLGPEGYAALGPEASLWRLWPALAMTLCLFATQWLLGGAGSVIMVTGGCLAAFYLWLWTNGLGQADAVALHLLPDVPLNGPAFGLPDLTIIDWSAVALAVPTLAAVVVLNLIGLLLNTAGVELANSDAVDVNAELRVSGSANLLIGLFGGLTSYLQGGASIIASKLGVERRAFVFGHLFVLLLAAAFAGPMVAAVPVFVAAALLIYIGLAMLWDWLIVTFNQLVAQDWLIVLGIVGLTVAFGILPAVIAGLVLAALSFAISYARLPVIRQATDLALHPSVLDRSAAARAHLVREGHRVPVLYLQGALFFGSVEQLTTRLVALENDAANMRSVVLDFSGARTFDSSACAAMVRLGRLFDAKGITIWLAGMAPALKDVIARWGLVLPDTGRPGGLRQADTLDQALEIAEDDLLALAGIGAEAAGLTDLLHPLCDNHPRLADLIRLMARQELQTGDVLIRASDPSRDVFFIETGRLGVFIPNRSIEHRRVRSAGPGGVIGEMAYLTAAPRGADVEAEAPTVVHRLGQAAIDALRRDDPELATLLAFLLGRSVAVKLTQTNALMMAGK